MTNVEELIGKKYGYLTILSDAGLVNLKNGYNRTKGYRYVNVRCDCGIVKSIILNNIVAGHTISCGCVRKRTNGRVKVRKNKKQNLFKKNMLTLNEYASMYGTDKGPNGHNYTPYYDMFFKSMRLKMPNVLEIGIDEGNSLKMWAKYFEGGLIHGIDLRGDYDYLKEWKKENKAYIKTHVVDQSNKADLVLFGEKFSDYFSIIICDGSHNAEDDILTFETLFPYLKSGGYFAIEDTLCSTDKNRWGKVANIYDRIKQMIDEVHMNGKMSVDSLCSNKIKEAPKYNLNYFEANIEWVWCSAGLTIIKKI